MIPKPWLQKGWGDERLKFCVENDVHSINHDKGVHYLGIFTSDKSKLVAACKWRLEDEATFNEPGPPPEKMYEPGCVKEAVDTFWTRIHKARKDIMGPKTYWRKYVPKSDRQRWEA